jgi:hypothetical protein
MANQQARSQAIDIADRLAGRGGGQVNGVAVEVGDGVVVCGDGSLD